jgi:hypothetical protein
VVKFNVIEPPEILNLLQKEGFVKLKEEQMRYAPMFVRTYSVHLTEKGEPYRQKSTKDAHVVRMCVLEVEEVTGIQQNADKTRAEVHYTVKSTNFSPFAALQPKGPCFRLFSDKKATLEKAVFSDIAKLALFDDGWRVVSLGIGAK